MYTEFWQYCHFSLVLDSVRLVFKFNLCFYNRYFTACLAVPWQGQQNFTIAMQSFSVTRYLNIEIAYSLP